MSRMASCMVSSSGIALVLGPHEVWGLDRNLLACRRSRLSWLTVTIAFAGSAETALASGVEAG